MPQDLTATPHSRCLDERMLARLAPAHWVDGGPITGWKPVHSRFAKPLALPGHRPKFVFTWISGDDTHPVIDRWTEHQRSLVVPRKPGRDGMVFWRLAVRQRAFAIDAYPRSDVPATIERARKLAQRAGRLQAALAFLPGELVPAWVVHDGTDPVFVGMPDHHLVPTTDAGESLAAILAMARVKTQVHEVSSGPIADAAP